MKARYLKQDALGILRESIFSNLDRYRQGTFTELTGDSANFFEGAFDYDESALETLLIPTQASDFEAENCAKCFKSLDVMSPYEARDERFWTYITHTCLLDYTRARWPIPIDDAVAVPHIQRHFFAANKRAIERDNSASRLWWMAHLCHRVKGISLEDSLQVLHFRTDVRANIIERPTVNQNTQIFGALLKTLKASYDNDQILFDRDRFRAMMVDLNSIGGATLLDTMSETQIFSVLDKIIQSIAAPGWKPNKAKPTVEAKSDTQTTVTGRRSPPASSRTKSNTQKAAKAAKLKAAKARASKTKPAKHVAQTAKATEKAPSKTQSKKPSAKPSGKIKPTLKAKRRVR